MASKLKEYKKIAIIHDVLLEYGGSEVVLTQLIKMYPTADVYTFYYNKNDLYIFNKFGSKVKSSFFSKLYILGYFKKYFSIFKTISWIYFLFLNLDTYDLVISSCHSYGSKIVSTRKNSVHICYIHTPPRYLYSLPSELSFINSTIGSVVFSPFLSLMRIIDKYATNKPNILIANSHTVQKRIESTYGLKSQVIYPPVKMQKNINTKIEMQKRYFIAHSRLVKQKGFDLIIKTFNKTNFPLVIVGSGYLKKELRSNANKNIIFTGFVDTKQLQRLYQRAVALVFASKNEDFGIVPVESQSFGVPVIAYKSGGVNETVVPYKTGVFFKKYSVNSLINSINLFLKLNFSTQDCVENAKKFSEDSFVKKMRKVVKNAK